MKRISLSIKTTKFFWTSSSRSVVANGVQWLPHRKKDQHDQYSPKCLRAPRVWTWEWEKEKLKELRRRITPSPRGCLISRRSSRKSNWTWTGTATWNTRGKSRKWEAIFDRVWEARLPAATVWLISHRARTWKCKIRWMTNNNIRWRRMMAYLWINKTNRFLHPVTSRNRSQPLRIRTKSQLSLVMLRIELYFCLLRGPRNQYDFYHCLKALLVFIKLTFSRIFD